MQLKRMLAKTMMLLADTFKPRRTYYKRRRFRPWLAIYRLLSSDAAIIHLLIICLGLTTCSLFLWLLASAQADFTLPQPRPETMETRLVLAATEEPTRFKPAQLPNDPDKPPSGAESSKPEGGEAAKRELKQEPRQWEPGQWDPPPLLALTFDDGPATNTTPLLLDGLRERGVHVTFFMLGVRAERVPEIVWQAFKDGHAIGGHSYDHRAYFTKISVDSLKEQLQETDDIIAGITGEEPPILLRPPYGAINEAVAQNTGKANILWNIDPRDWAVRDAELIRDSIMESATDGGVVILHDIYPASVEGALMAIDLLLAEGWQLVTIPELFAVYDIPLQAGGIYRSPQNYSLPEEIEK
jgi:peptidoglycan/xylan/chitin deacetylase (PgdA/CDA1 family)